MKIKVIKFKVEHNNFIKMRGGFEDCLRYSQAKELKYLKGKGYAIIEFSSIGGSFPKKEILNLYIRRWESFGFKLTKIRDNIIVKIKVNDESPTKYDYKYFEAILSNGEIKVFNYHINNPIPTSEEMIGLT